MSSKRLFEFSSYVACTQNIKCFCDALNLQIFHLLLTSNVCSDLETETNCLCVVLFSWSSTKLITVTHSTGLVLVKYIPQLFLEEFCWRITLQLYKGGCYGTVCFGEPLKRLVWSVSPEH